MLLYLRVLSRFPPLFDFFEKVLLRQKKPDCQKVASGLSLPLTQNIFLIVSVCTAFHPHYKNSIHTIKLETKLRAR